MSKYLEVDGQPLYRVEVEVSKRKVLYIVAKDAMEAEDAAWELADDTRYVKVDDEFDDDVRARPVLGALAEGEFVWVGGEDGDWHRWTGRDVVPL